MYGKSGYHPYIGEVVFLKFVMIQTIFMVTDWSKQNVTMYTCSRVYISPLFKK